MTYSKSYRDKKTSKKKGSGKSQKQRKPKKKRTSK